jgi:hypothetical protein
MVVTDLDIWVRDIQGDLPARLPDGGPTYVETAPSRIIVEPWNAASAILFLAVVLVWAIRLRGRYRRHAFLTCCLPILAAGGIGGTLYHAFRAYKFFFWMDVLPIYLLGLAASLYFCYRLRLNSGHLIGLIVVYLLLQALLFPLFPTQAAINLSYAFLAALLLLPIAILLRKTGYRDGLWVALGLLLFVVALFFRWADGNVALLPMGTHWLWHIFGAATVAAVTEYVFRVERAPLP